MAILNNRDRLQGLSERFDRQREGSDDRSRPMVGPTPESFRAVPPDLKDMPQQGKDAYRKIMELAQTQAEYIRTQGSQSPQKALEFEERFLRMVKDTCKPMIEAAHAFEAASHRAADDVLEKAEQIGRGAALFTKRVEGMSASLYAASNGNDKTAPEGTREDPSAEEPKTNRV